MNFIETARFRKAYQILPQDVKERVKKTLLNMDNDIRYPSLHAKKIQGAENIWEARIDLDYRITFQIINDSIILRNVGHHNPTLKNP